MAKLLKEKKYYDKKVAMADEEHKKKYL